CYRVTDANKHALRLSSVGWGGIEGRRIVDEANEKIGDRRKRNENEQQHAHRCQKTSEPTTPIKQRQADERDQKGRRRRKDERLQQELPTKRIHRGVPVLESPDADG